MTTSLAASATFLLSPNVKADKENDAKKIEILTEIFTGSTIGGPIKIEQTYTEENRDTDTQKNNAMRNILKEQNTR